MKNKKEAPKARVSKHERVSTATAQDYAHQHSARIVGTRRLFEYEVAELDSEVVGLTAALARARERKAHLTAQIEGLGQILAKR